MHLCCCLYQWSLSCVGLRKVVFDGRQCMPRVMFFPDSDGADIWRGNQYTVDRSGTGVE